VSPTPDTIGKGSVTLPVASWITTLLEVMDSPPYPAVDESFIIIDVGVEPTLIEKSAIILLIKICYITNLLNKIIRI
jgi:hypothetical protein